MAAAIFDHLAKMREVARDKILISLNNVQSCRRSLGCLLLVFGDLFVLASPARRLGEDDYVSERFRILLDVALSTAEDGTC